MNSKLHAVCDGHGRPLVLLLSEGQMSDHKGARLVLEALPSAATLIADRGYDSNWFRAALSDKGIEPCIPSTRSRKSPLPYDVALYKQRHKIENMFGRLKDCGRPGHGSRNVGAGFRPPPWKWVWSRRTGWNRRRTPGRHDAQLMARLRAK